MDEMFRVKAGLEIDKKLKEKFEQMYEKNKEEAKKKKTWFSNRAVLHPCQFWKCNKCGITFVVPINPKLLSKFRCRYCHKPTHDITYYIG